MFKIPWVGITLDIMDKKTKAELEGLSNFFKVTQLTNGRDRIWNQTYLIANPACFYKKL